MRRRALLAASAASGGGNIFPIHLNLQKISNSEYRLDPTPESIALCDYFIANAVFDGAMNWTLYLNPRELYIDGIEVQRLDCEGSADKRLSTYGGWYPYHERYDDFWFTAFEIYYEDHYYPKGTFIVYDDD